MRLSLTAIILVVNYIIVFSQLPDCVIKNYNTSVKFSGKKLVEYTEVELQINSAKGLNYAEIEIPYSKGNSIKELKAGIYDISGKEIRKLKNKDIIRANAFSYQSFHSDDMTLSFKLIHNRYPYILKYSYYEEAEHYLYLSYWVPRFKKDLPVQQASLQLEVPEHYSMKIFQQGLQIPTVDSVAGIKTYLWQAKDIDFVEREKFGPQSRELQAQVVVIPDNFRYGVEGNGGSWEQFGAWLTNLKENTSGLPEAEVKRLHQMTAECQSDREKIDVLYKYLQKNTRYINVSLDIGGLKPETATYVCENRYGDCKALTNFMQTMLNEVGIPSVYTIVHAGQHPVKVKEEYPSQQFNHVILCVPQAKDTIWLECTDNSAPFNYLGTFTQNRTVLLVDGENSKLARTPVLSDEDVADTYVTHIDIDSAGMWQASTNATLRGRAFDYLKSLNDGLPQRDKIDYLEDIELINYADITNFRLTSPGVDSAFINLTLDAKLVNAIEPIGNRMLIKPIRPFYLKLEKPEDRTQELRFSYPFNISDTIVYAMPKEIRGVSGLKNNSISSTVGSYEREVRVDGNKLIINRRVVIKAGVYQLDEYEAIYDFVKACGNTELQKGIIEYM